MPEEQTSYTIQVDEQQLNTLFREVLDGCRDDLAEAQANMEIYLKEILDTPTGKDLYGPVYNDALKIKGLARARQLQLISMLKDRVTIKEKINIDTGKNVKPGASSLTPDYMNSLIEDMMNSKKEELITITPVEANPSMPNQTNLNTEMPEEGTLEIDEDDLEDIDDNE